MYTLSETVEIFTKAGAGFHPHTLGDQSTGLVPDLLVQSTPCGCQHVWHDKEWYDGTNRLVLRLWYKKFAGNISRKGMPTAGYKTEITEQH